MPSPTSPPPPSSASAPSLSPGPNTSPPPSSPSHKPTSTTPSPASSRSPPPARPSPPSTRSSRPRGHALPDPSISFLPFSTIIARSSSNGLLCCFTPFHDPSYFVYNPATAAWAEISPSPLHLGSDSGQPNWVRA